MKDFVKFSSNNNNNKIDIEDLTTGRRFLADGKIISEIVLNDSDVNILDQYGLSKEENEDCISSNAVHWLNRNWHLPLFYYLSSRNVKYYDNDQYGVEKRKLLLQSYLKQDTCNERYVPSGKEFILPGANELNPSLLEHQALGLNRRSKRSFNNVPCRTQELSDLLFNGLLSVKTTREYSTEEDILNYCKSYCVSFDFYIAIYNVENIEPGIYYYDLVRHVLILIEAKDFREDICDILQGMQAPKSANLTIFFISDLMQYVWRYRHERALMSVYMQAGQICQEIIDSGLSLMLQGLCTPATKDTILIQHLKLNKYKFTPVYTLTLGK
jgi:SagB-type dehydrogenase family enzyme